MRAGLTVLLTLAATTAAGDISLELPIDCVLGETCHIQNYVDQDSGPGVQDFHCGPLGYDGHKGTDFALPTLRDMVDGVNVLAAAPGIVRASRDGMDDRLYEPGNASEIENRECGNGVVIQHDDGWETQYCHMKRGSVQVGPGDAVEAGTALGEVGLSGKTQFPHLHLSVRQDGRVIDPFNPAGITGCAPDTSTLWQTPLTYVPGALILAGFSDHVPDYADIRAGTAARDALPADASGLVLFGYAFGGLDGDVLRLTIDGPDGQVIAHEATLEKDQAQFFRAAGRRLRGDRWPAGTYRGNVTMLRDGVEISRKSIEMTME